MPGRPLRPMYYRLDRQNKVALPCLTPDEGLEQFSPKLNRVIKQETLPGGIRVSTVFLVMDHAFLDDEEPQLFETLVFNDYGSGEMRRYSTWAEAEQGHDEIVAKLMAEATARNPDPSR
jgi:hypothetical protein